MRKYCLTLELKNDQQLIQQYEDHHKAVWPEVIHSIREAGILSMEIYRLGTRLVMTLEVEDDFSFVMKDNADRKNPKVQEWEGLMWKYQQPLAEAAEGEKWMEMNKIFELK